MYEKKIHKGIFEIIITIKKINSTTITIDNEFLRGDHHRHSIPVTEMKITCRSTCMDALFFSSYNKRQK